MSEGGGAEVKFVLKFEPPTSVLPPSQTRGIKGGRGQAKYSGRFSHSGKETSGHVRIFKEIQRDLVTIN
jgi:hypothetical protein